MTELPLSDLLDEFDAAQAYSLALVEGLTAEQVAWRPNADSSAITWHLGHQGAVAHYMVRNLTAAEVSFDPAFDSVFDSATPEPERGNLPPLEDIITYRESIATSTRRVIERIDQGDVGAPEQLTLVARGLLTSVVTHEYQHAKWIGEVRSTMLDAGLPIPSSQRLVEIDGYWILGSR